MIDGLIYLNAKAVKFFRQNIISAKNILSILKLIFTLIKSNYKNLVIFFNISSSNFVTTFKFLGSSYYNFIITVFSLAFRGDYVFTNYLFIYDILNFTICNKEEFILNNKELNDCFDYVDRENLYKYDESYKFNDFLDYHSDGLENVIILIYINLLFFFNFNYSNLITKTGQPL